MPTLSQGEFGFCTDSGAEELYLGNGTKNLQIPFVKVYYDDMNNLVSSGIYRVGTNTNLHDSLWYSQVLVMQGADSDTVAQIGVSYSTGNLVTRSGQRSGDAWRFTDWVMPYSNANPVDISRMGGVARSGDSMTGILNMANTDDYVGVQKIRDINDLLYYFAFGIGNDTGRGASGSLRLTNGNGDVLGRIDVWENGELTYKNANTGYTPIPKFATGSYVGTGKYGSSNKNSLTFDFKPQVVIVAPTYGFEQTSIVSMTDNSTSEPVIMNFAAMAIRGQTRGFRAKYELNATNHYCYINWTDNGLSWYSDYEYSTGANIQMNISGTVYHYFAIG